MLNKELKYVHDKSYLQRHPKLQPKMRAILLDWLLEVSMKIFNVQKFDCSGFGQILSLCLNALAGE